MNAKGPIEILAREIGADYTAAMERPAVLFAYLRQLLGHIEWDADIGKRCGSAISEHFPRLLERTYELCDGALSVDESIVEAKIIDDLIREVDDDDGWPTDRHLSLLDGILCAVRFGLETPCRSRWPAEAGNELFKHRYGLTLFDRYTNRWSKEWLQDRFADALRALENGEKPDVDTDHGCGSEQSERVASSSTTPPQNNGGR